MTCDETTVLSDEELAEIVNRVFRQRASTLQDEALLLDAARITATIHMKRAEMRDVVDSLPAAAFMSADRPVAGEAGWTAGQIISHNADRLLWALGNAQVAIAPAVVLDPPTALRDGAQEPPQALDRQSALALLWAADTYLNDALPKLLEADDGQTATGTHHGTMGLAAWLLLVAIHDDDHLRQLRDRATAEG